MNKNIQKNLGWIILAVAVLAGAMIFWLFIKSALDDYFTEKTKFNRNERQIKEFDEKEKELISQETAEANQLKSLKPIYESNIIDTNNNSTAVYGTMFDKLIKLAQANGLMIRSVEYNTTPQYDEVFNNFPDAYSACEFKFFFIGSYNQFKSYLNDISNKFEYFLSISDLNVTAFNENPDYLLIKVSFTLYAKKGKSPAAAQQQSGGTVFSRNSGRQGGGKTQI